MDRWRLAGAVSLISLLSLLIHPDCADSSLPSRTAPACQVIHIPHLHSHYQHHHHQHRHAGSGCWETTKKQKRERNLNSNMELYRRWTPNMFNIWLTIKFKYFVWDTHDLTLPSNHTVFPATSKIISGPCHLSVAQYLRDTCWFFQPVVYYAILMSIHVYCCKLSL